MFSVTYNTGFISAFGGHGFKSRLRYKLKDLTVKRKVFSYVNYSVFFYFTFTIGNCSAWSLPSILPEISAINESPFNS